jgi:hypothetical protein
MYYYFNDSTAELYTNPRGDLDYASLELYIEKKELVIKGGRVWCSYNSSWSSWRFAGEVLPDFFW